MEGFTIPTSDTEWPDEQYFADSKDIEDVDGVLEGMCAQFRTACAFLRNVYLFDLYCVTAPLSDLNMVLSYAVVASRIEKRPENLYDKKNFGILLALVKYVPYPCFQL